MTDEPYPPKFTAPLVPVEVVEGSTVRLQATVDAYPPECTFTWYFNDVPVQPRPPYIVIESDRTVSTLIITDIRMHTAGEFSVVARNTQGYALSMARVDVKVTGKELVLSV